MPADNKRNWNYTRMGVAISLEFANACSLQDCEIAHLGADGIEIRRGCSGNLLQGNHLFDIGANGIMVGEGRGEQYESNPVKLVRNNQVVNNLIHDCGRSYYGAVGIWVGFTENTRVAHNLIRDLPYSGISVGWQWDKQPTNCKNNLIEYNHVHHVMQLMNDGGGIYTLGHQSGTMIRGNVVDDVGNGKSVAARGLYLDEGSDAFIVESNMIFKITADPVWSAFAPQLSENHTWRGNIFTRADPLVAGIVGYGSLFENGSYLEIPHTPALDPNTLTVSAWVKFFEFPTGKDPCVWIVNKNNNELTNGNYALMVSHKNIGAYLNIGGGRDNLVACWSATNSVFSNQWNHLAMTYDGRDLKVYCNGILSGTTPVSRQLSNSTLSDSALNSQPSTLSRPRTTGTGNLRIGKGAESWSPEFHGIMDEIRIYNRALSAEEIATQYAHPSALGPQPSTLTTQLISSPTPNSNLPSPNSNLQSPISNHDSSLIAYWPFDDLKEKLQHAMELAGPQEPYRSRFAESRETRVASKKRDGNIQGNRAKSLVPVSPAFPETSTQNSQQSTDGEQPPASVSNTTANLSAPIPTNETLLVQAMRLAGSATGTPGELLLKKGDRIVAIGDSITIAGGYLRDIDTVIARQYPELQIPVIINAGVSGQKAENLIVRFQKDVVDQRPAIVTINVGINDVSLHLQSPPDDTVLKAYKENIAKMVDTAQAAGIKVILLTPTIIQETPTSDGNQRLLQYSLVMRGIARDKQCRFVNLHAMFLKALGHKPAGMTANWLTSDGVHMQPLGDAIMALGVLRALGVPDAKIAGTELPER